MYNFFMFALELTITIYLGIFRKEKSTIVKCHLFWQAMYTGASYTIFHLKWTTLYYKNEQIGFSCDKPRIPSKVCLRAEPVLSSSWIYKDTWDHCQLHIRTVDMAKGASLLLRYNGIDHISCCSCSLSDCKLNAIQTYTISPIPALKIETCENLSLLQSYQKNLWNVWVSSTFVKKIRYFV